MNRNWNPIDELVEHLKPGDVVVFKPIKGADQATIERGLEELRRVLDGKNITIRMEN